MPKEIVLITGGLGQIGSDLADQLYKSIGRDNVIVSDIKPEPQDFHLPYVKLDVLDQSAIERVIEQYNVTTVYHLAAMLSATSEKLPLKAWELNTQSLLHFLELAKNKRFSKLFWPSSIAVFGNDAPKNNTPQDASLKPSTVYGISKVAGELWAEYYFKNYGVDIRSVRYPGLISWKSKPGGGTTDYAVEIFHEALAKNAYTSFLSENTYLPMMYMEDAIHATIALMNAPKENVKIRSSYNLGGLSFSPKEIAEAIKAHIPEFRMHYKPDFRQKIADSWPNSIDDHRFLEDINFTAKFDLKQMTEDMFSHLHEKV